MVLDMKLSDKDKAYLRSLKEKPDSDEIRSKNVFKQRLLGNDLILYALNNKQFEEEDSPADEYFDVNIHDTLIVDFTQTEVENHICYDVGFDEIGSDNSDFKIGQLAVNILCNLKNNKEAISGIARHDLLAQLIIEEFNYSNCMGSQLVLVENMPSVVDDQYAMRSLMFEFTTPNNLVSSKSGETEFINRVVVK